MYIIRESENINNITTKEEIGKIVRNKFKESKMSLRELMRRTGLSNSRLKGIFEGSTDYTITSLFKVLKELNLKITLLKENI
jgi:transcriptional regulator with XRE-family HTH domain